MPISATRLETFLVLSCYLYLRYQSNETLRKMQGWSSDDREMELIDVKHFKKYTCIHSNAKELLKKY